MNAPLTRRALLSATAAVGAVGLHTAAVASTVDPDVDLFVLLDRFAEAAAAWEALDEPYAAALNQAEAGYPPRSEALHWRHSDFPRTSYGRAASDAIDDTGRREYRSRGVAWLRNLQSAVQWNEDAEARRQEIVEAHDAWVAARKAVEDATGYTAAAGACAVAAQAFNAAEEAVKLCQPRTLVGLRAKGVWVADRIAGSLHEENDFGEAFARQVAAFGGMSS